MNNPALSGLLDLDAEPVRAFFRQAPVMMHAIDRSGSIVAVTGYWAARLGYLPEEMIGRRSVEFLTPRSRRLAEQEVMPRFFRDGEIERQPYEFQRKDGGIFPVLLSAVTLRTPDGELDKALAFMVEENAGDLLQRDLQAALLRAERANRSKSDFLKAMSHELRTPMNAILGFAQLLKLTQLTTKQEAHVDAILESSRQLVGRLTDLLDLAQLEFADIELTQVAVAPDDIVMPLGAVWTSSVRAKGLSFDVDVDPALPARLLLDKAQVQRVLHAFLSNALAATETGGIRLGVVCVSSDEMSARVRFLVSDTGPGLAPHLVQEVLERSPEAAQVASKTQGGCGLGLAICKAIAAALGGEIDVDTRPGRGATFSLTLDVCVVREAD